MELILAMDKVQIYTIVLIAAKALRAANLLGDDGADIVSNKDKAIVLITSTSAFIPIIGRVFNYW